MIVARSVLISSSVISAGRKVVVTPTNLCSRPLGRRSFFWGGNQHRPPGSSGSGSRSSKSWFRSSFTSTTISPSRDPGLEWTSVISDPKEVEGPRGVPSRAEQIRRLQSPTVGEDGVFDILVIGGGATGAGIAMDAAQRGLQTACIERGDFSSETSSRSTKLIWVRTIFHNN
jgi:FAD dependent oxidoreductase